MHSFDAREAVRVGSTRRNLLSSPRLATRPQIGSRRQGGSGRGSVSRDTWPGTWLRSPAFAPNEAPPARGSVSELFSRSTEYGVAWVSRFTNHWGDDPKMTNPI